MEDKWKFERWEEAHLDEVRGFHFEGGESLHEVAERAAEGIRLAVDPVLNAKGGGEGKHVVIVAHGVSSRATFVDRDLTN